MQMMLELECLVPISMGLVVSNHMNVAFLLTLSVIALMKNQCKLTMEWLLLDMDFLIKLDVRSIGWLKTHGELIGEKKAISDSAWIAPLKQWKLVFA